ncbi:MAG: hypothetical protein ACXV2J_07800 [Actinomycetes bacterium]
MSEDGAAAWQAQRRDAADEHLAAIERRKAAESEAAAVLLREFVAAARDRGVQPTSLRAKSFNGRSTYRTRLEGWYLKRNRSVAVGTDGQFYVLVAPTSVTARLRGVDVRPSAAPLVVGAGGRDGESVPLETLLSLRLDAADTWTG